MMNLMHWRLLVAIADSGNITRAAEQVGMTQSGASQALALVEDTLGVQLFTRENRQTLPTAIGFQVLEQARLMLAALQAIRETADQARPIQRGSIRLASFPMVLATFLPPLLRLDFIITDLQRQHLDARVQLIEVEALLAAGLTDVGVVLNPPAGGQARLLGLDSWVAVLPVGHALARRSHEQGLALAELVAQPFVLATGGCSVNARSLALDAGLVLADVRVEVREWNSAFTLVREQVGVSLVPQSTLPDNRQGLRILPLSVPIDRRFALVPAPGRPPSLAVQALLDMLDG